SISGDIWDNDMNSLILKDYLKTGVHIYLQTYIEYGKIESLLPYLEKIWELEPKDYLKVKIIKKLSKAHIDKLEFIRNVEPDKYLFAMCLSDNEYDNHTLLDCLNEIAEDTKPFGILNLSRLHRWDLIEEEIKKYCD
ncbi:MAG: hypothetical protein PF588_08595, partial [Candidatus Kapabacteria bacterium]|nr:hypothetical protein [Candidatus Kapabacteria bacterium]